jgi:hypothetical protein
LRERAAPSLTPLDEERHRATRARSVGGGADRLSRTGALRVVPACGEASHELEAAASPADVWGLWADPDRWSDWNGDIEQAWLEGPFEVGGRARIKFRGRPAMRFTVTALEHERLFVDEARLPLARIGHEHRLEALDGGVRILNRLYIAGPAAPLYGLVMGRRMRRSVIGFVERERELAERARAVGPGASSEPRECG